MKNAISLAPRRRRTTALVGTWTALWLAGASLGAQTANPPDDTFQASERITAIDLLVEVYPKLIEGVIDPAWRQVPHNLEPSDFEIDDRGETRTPITVATEADEPWRIVVYVDQHLSSTASIRRGASLLAAHAEQLAELGQVEMVAATPGLRQRLAPTREPELIDSTLSHLAITGSGDDRLRALRAEYLRSREDPDLATPGTELAAAYAAEETRLVQNGFDDLLLRLLDARTPRERKALFLVTDGFDLDPREFYADAPPGEASALATSYREFLRAIASYGWVVVPIRSPLVYKYPDSIGPRRALLIKIDRNRNPERAEALVELARAQLEQGEWAKAEGTLEEAIHRFFDHPKTRARQALAETLLADALTQQGRHDAAELALRRAVALDPSLEAEHRSATAGFVEPQAPLTAIAEASAGVVATDGDALGELVDNLAHRVRVTYQIPGAPDGELYPVAVSIDRLRYGARSAAWVRSSTPEAVAAARVRHRLRSYESQHDDTLEAQLEARPSGLRAVVKIPTIESELPSGPFRVTVALDGEAMLPSVGHRIVAADATTAEIEVERPSEAEWVALLVEDLGTGESRELFASAP